VWRSRRTVRCGGFTTEAADGGAAADVKNEPFCTIGHSTRSIDEFVGMLQHASVAQVVDIRTVPRSRTNPRYDREALTSSLGPFGIGYEHLAALGGLRGKRRDVPRDLNAFWRNESFHNDADYAMGEDFHAGLARLRELGRGRRCAILCAEAVWWRGHRRIVADYLQAGGADVLHLMGPAHAEPARLTIAARAIAPDVLAYPALPEEMDREPSAS